MCRTGMQIVDLMMAIEGVQGIGDGGSGGVNERVSLSGKE
jgi:hypothetical protein